MHVIDKQDLPVAIADESGFELRMREEGDMIVNLVPLPAGDVFSWAPGHVPGALEDAEYVDFAPPAAFLQLMAHVQGRPGA
jgi:hypothetical protein